MFKNKHDEKDFKIPKIGEISLLDILDILIKKRWIIIVFSLIIAIIIASMGVYIFYKSPTYQKFELNFTLKFKGSDDFKYPNGMDFTEEDIITKPILREVYNKLDLSNYFSSFRTFASLIGVKRYNPKLAFLNHEFNAKLKDTNLSSSERYSLEQEFYRQTNIARLHPDYVLSFFYPKNLKEYNVPSEVISKVLYEILNEWMSEAKAGRGVTSHNINLIRNHIDENLIKNLDFFNSADYLKNHLNELKIELEEIEKLPNSNQKFIKFDEKEYTLRDLRNVINNTQNYLINHLFYLIKKYKLTKDNYSTRIYIESQISNLKFRIDDIIRHRDMYESMILRHAEISKDELIELEKTQHKYQNQLSFYKKFLLFFSNSKETEKAVLSNDVLRKVNEVQNAIVKQQNKVIDILKQFYVKLSKSNLDRNTEFYTINSFSAFAYNTLKGRYIFRIYLMIFLIIEALMVGIIILSDLLKRRQKETSTMMSDYYKNIRVIDSTNIRTLPEKSENIEKRKKLPKE